MTTLALVGSIVALNRMAAACGHIARTLKVRVHRVDDEIDSSLGVSLT